MICDKKKHIKPEIQANYSQKSIYFQICPVTGLKIDCRACIHVVDQGFISGIPYWFPEAEVTPEHEQLWLQNKTIDSIIKLHHCPFLRTDVNSLLPCTLVFTLTSQNAFLQNPMNFLSSIQSILPKMASFSREREKHMHFLAPEILSTQLIIC